MVVFIGVDLSLSSPAMCLHDGNGWSYNNCKFFYLTSRKKSVVNDSVFTSELHKKFESEEERYDQISDFFINHIIPISSSVIIEGYSFGSVGSRLFQIAENGHCLKHKLYKLGIKFITPAPTTIKKFAGKGNFSKLQMDAAFQKDTGIDISKTLNCQTADSPANDVVDAYFLCKYGFHIR